MRLRLRERPCRSLPVRVSSIRKRRPRLLVSWGSIRRNRMRQPRRIDSAVAEFHQPTDGKQGEYKAAEAISAVIQPLFIRFFGGDSHHHRREEREKKRGFEMRKI